MKKMYRFVMAAVFLLCLLPQTCFALMYANADANYPIWNTGNRGGSALDLSSCVITEDSESKRVICAINYRLTYTEGDGRTYENGSLEPNGYVYFTEDKLSGTDSVLATNMRQPLEILPNTTESQALALVKSQVGEE